MIVAESNKPAAEALLKIFDGSNSKMEACSERLGFANALALELEQRLKLPFASQETFKPKPQLLVFDYGLLAKQRFVGLQSGRRDKIQWI